MSDSENSSCESRDDDKYSIKGYIKKSNDKRGRWITLNKAGEPPEEEEEMLEIILRSYFISQFQEQIEKKEDLKKLIYLYEDKPLFTLKF